MFCSALGWFGGRPTCAWSRAAPRPSCRSTRRFSLPTCSTATTCTTRRSARRVDAAGRRERRARVRCLSMCWLKLELEKWIRSQETADTCSSSTPPTAGRPRVKSNNERSNNVESRRASHCAVVWPNTIDDGPRGCGCGAGLGCAACAALGVWLRRCQRRACRCRAPPPADSSSYQQSCASARRRAR